MIQVKAYFIPMADMTWEQHFNFICTLPITWHGETRLLASPGDGYVEITGTIDVSSVEGASEVALRDPTLIDAVQFSLRATQPAGDEAQAQQYIA